jgi:hypothetical protein
MDFYRYDPNARLGTDLPHDEVREVEPATPYPWYDEPAADLRGGPLYDQPWPDQDDEGYPPDDDMTDADVESAAEDVFDRPRFEPPF